MATPATEAGPAGPDGTVTWAELRAEAARRLSRTASPDPETDARRIVERASGYSGAELVVAAREPASRRAVAFYDTMLARREQGEPLQYVLGLWGFRTLDLLVDHRVLIPRPETEMVVEHALAEHDRLQAADPSRTLTVVDLGTGSGAIALSVVAERPRTRVWATDRSQDALDVASANLTGLGLRATRVQLARGSWFEALPPELAGAIDLVVSNPPYVGADEHLPPEVADWEPAGALVPGPTGLEDLLHLVEVAPRWLARPGVLVMELAPAQAGTIVDAAVATGYDEAVALADLTGRERAVVAWFS